MVDIEHISPRILWYAVGLITTDGNLSSDKRYISITSKDVRHLELVRSALGLNVNITMKSRGGSFKKIYGFLQFGDVRFYRFLLSIGMMPRKSLVLASLDVPTRYFKDFLRGVIDGDGSIVRWTHSTNNHEQWSLNVHSASYLFLEWLQAKIAQHLGAQGRIFDNCSNGENTVYKLKFGKVSARHILRATYYDGAIALERKRLLAKSCINSYVGWKRSQTLTP